MHPAGRTWRGAGLGEPVFRLRLVGFGDRGPASGEHRGVGSGAGVPVGGAGGRPPTGSTPGQVLVHPRVCWKQRLGRQWGSGGGSGEAVKAGTGRGWGHWGVHTTGLLNN